MKKIEKKWTTRIVGQLALFSNQIVLLCGRTFSDFSCAYLVLNHTIVLYWILQLKAMAQNVDTDIFWGSLDRQSIYWWLKRSTVSLKKKSKWRKTIRYEVDILFLILARGRYRPPTYLVKKLCSRGRCRPADTRSLSYRAEIGLKWKVFVCIFWISYNFCIFIANSARILVKK